jgi:hypothetical protein
MRSAAVPAMALERKFMGPRVKCGISESNMAGCDSSRSERT